jgi:pimeloyl-ACP methyl ester carboxylesterase
VSCRIRLFADAAERLKGRISDYELKTIPDSGHFIPMEKPQACADTISDFVHRKLGFSVH